VHGIASFALTSLMMITLLGAQNEAPSFENMLRRSPTTTSAIIQTANEFENALDARTAAADFRKSAATASFTALTLLVVGVLSSALGANRGFKAAKRAEVVSQSNVGPGIKPAQ
jgi:hypothetical protein